MNKSYVIYWKSRTNGRIGTGTTRFNQDEASQLVEELNRDFPEIEHQALSVDSPGDCATVPIPFPVTEIAE